MATLGEGIKDMAIEVGFVSLMTHDFRFYLALDFGYKELSNTHVSFM